MAKKNSEDLLNEFNQKPTWNPITGCSKISSGCVNCYAEKIAHWQHRLENSPKCNRAYKKYANIFVPTMHENELQKPYHWKKGKRKLIDGMGDLFHEAITTEFILRLFEVMHDNPQHLYLILTKRAERLAEIGPSLPWEDHILMGVTVEEARYKNRIDLLRASGALRKVISAEPLLGDLGELDLREIEWIFAGAESGENCRPMENEWIDSLIDQCESQHVHFTFKQNGGVFRRRNGATIDGVRYDYMPQVPVLTLT